MEWALLFGIGFAVITPQFIANHVNIKNMQETNMGQLTMLSSNEHPKKLIVLKRALTALAIMSVAFLAACSNSNRVFDPRTPPSNKPPRQAQNGAIYNAPSDDIVTPQTADAGYAGVATGTIVSEPLPVLGGGQVVPSQSLAPNLAPNPTQPPMIASAAGAQTNVPTLTPPSGGGRQVADLRPATEQVTPRAANAGGSVVGAWAAKDATGSKCKVQLSSAPAVDLYKASAAGCANKDLAKITAWDQIGRASC